MKSKPWLHVRIRNKAIEFIVLLFRNALWIKQPKWLHLIHLFFVQINGMANEITVFFDDSWNKIAPF